MKINELTNGALIMEYARARVIFYNNMSKQTSEYLVSLQNELLDRNIITLDDLARDVY